MTLVLIEVRSDGVIMAADSAITEALSIGGGDFTRVLHGAEKLFRHDGCKAGIATWGSGYATTHGQKTIPLEFLIKHFIHQTEEVTDLQSLADQLVHLLNHQVAYGEIGDVGFEMAGYEASSGHPLTLRVSNITPPPPLEPTRAFQVWESRLQRPYDPDTDASPIVMGDTNVSQWMSRVGAAVDLMVGLTNADNALAARAARWASMVRFVGELYVNPYGEPSVSPTVSTLVIPYAGEMNFNSHRG